MKAEDNEFPHVTFAESAAPSTPASGLLLVYAKSDGKLYYKNDAGTEVEIGAAAGFTVQDENSNVATGVTQLDFQGASVSAASGSGEVVVTVTGGGSSESWEDTVTALANKVHRWQFNETSGTNVDDAIGSLDLTLSGTYTRNVAGLVGVGTTFGSGAKAVSSGLGSIPTGDNARCFIMLYKSTDGGKQTLLAYGSASTRAWFTGFLNDGGTDRITTSVYNDDMLIQNPPVLGSDFHLAAFGYDGNRNIYAYLDGLCWASRPGGTLSTGSGGNFTIGQDITAGNQFLGDIEDYIVTTSWPGKRRLDRMYRTLAAL